jgi:hypothetical protein
MGGFGSGNRHRYGTKSTVKGRTSLDINRWAREGHLSPGSSFSWQWTWGDGKKSSISVQVEAPLSIRLTYRHRYAGETDWTDVDQSIALERTPCHFGGERVWFRCPGCGRRVAKLYSVGCHYVCRHCGKLVYESQREDATLRALTRANRLLRKIDPASYLMAPFPEKPKGMHWRTYERLALAALAAGHEAVLGYREQVARLEAGLSRIEARIDGA